MWIKLLELILSQIIEKQQNCMKKPKNYYCHRQSNQESVQIVNRNVQVLEKIGQGTFGEVYKVFDPSTSSLAVVKKIKNQSLLSQQAKILSELSSSDGFDRLKSSIAFSQTNAVSDNQNESTIMMSCLGPSTGTIMRKIKRMNIYSMKKIAYQAIKKLKQIHNRSYVHRDLKPDNILLGNKYDCHSVYLIDFGLTTAYKKNSTKPRRILESIVGTAKYCPLASHEGIQQFPKDDLQSLGYVLLFYVQGSLHWQKEQEQSESNLFQKIYNKKKSSTVQDLCGGINCLRKYWCLVKGLSIGQKIEYEKILQLFDVGDPNLQNCFEFCQDCWIRKGIRHKQSEETQIIAEPKSNKIRDSILDYYF